MNNVKKGSILAGVYFLILFTAFTAYQYVIGRVFEEEGNNILAPYTLAISYSFFILSNAIAPAVTLSQKWQMVFSGIGYAVNYAGSSLIIGASTWEQYLIAGVGSAINGTTSGFLWVGVGRYLHNLCSINNEIKKKGHYFGLFNGIFCCSGVTGAIVVTFGLDLLSHSTYFILIGIIAGLAVVFAALFLPDIPDQQKSGSAGKMLLDTVRSYPVMVNALGVIWIEGICLGVLSTTILHLVPHTDDHKADELRVGFCLIAQGVGSLVSGYTGGRLCDVLKIKQVGFVVLTVYVCNCGISVIAALVDELWLSIVVCGCWGFCLYGVSSWLMVMVSKVYGGQAGQFGLVKQFHGIAFLIYQIVAILTDNSLPITGIMPVLLLFAVPSFLLLRKLPSSVPSK
jgi:hypothetical protein